MWFISRWVGDVVVAGLTKKAARCRRSRRRCTPYSVLASSDAASGTTFPRLRERPPVLAHRRHHGRWLPLLRSSSPFPTSPTLLLSRRRTQDGENPNAARLREEPDAGEK
jgi:hypothetical protein